MHINNSKQTDSIQMFVAFAEDIKCWRISSVDYLLKLSSNPQVYLDRRKGVKKYLKKTIGELFL